MTAPEHPRSVFEAAVEVAEDGYRLTVPCGEVAGSGVTIGEVYRVALLARTGADTGPRRSGETAPNHPQPPVEEGEIRYVEVEDLGKQGDGIARVERGYVIIVPGAAVGERVKVEVIEVRSNFAVGELLGEP